jgi:fumarate reductase (CoM/CoB) subunit A
VVAVQAVRTDVLVIGGGVAALRAAIAACEAGSAVLVCCKGIAGRSGNTVPSTADISAFLPTLGPDDSAETFSRDTLDAGATIADEDLVDILAERSGPALLDLERLGIRLLRSGDQIDRTRAAGHSRARTYRADSTGLGPNKGLALSVPLAERARGLGVAFRDRTPIVDLLIADGELVGAAAIDLETDDLLAITAGATVAAAGGASHLFARTNGTADATGDVIAMAMHAGAVARDLEFVQWHPTRMDQPVSLFLTNGLLADGAVFRDAAGREFMADYDERANLAPRDILAKAVYLEAASGRGIDGGVYLDCSAIPADRIALRHAYLAETLRKHDVDFPRQWLVVSPATHFLMGGIAIDSRAASSLPGLFVAGETAGGIHGANRLGGNAFCEGLVFGTIAGTAAAAHARERRVRPEVRLDQQHVTSRVDLTAPDPRPALQTLWHRLRTTMWQSASLVRDAEGLGAARDTVETLVADADAMRAPSVSAAARVFDLRAALVCARAIVAAAIFREESRGAHWRADFPETSDAWLGSTLVRWPEADSGLALEFRPKGPRADSDRLTVPVEAPATRGANRG